MLFFSWGQKETEGCWLQHIWARPWIEYKDAEDASFVLMELTDRQRKNMTQIATVQVSHPVVKIQNVEGTLPIP